MLQEQLSKSTVVVEKKKAAALYLLIHTPILDVFTFIPIPTCHSTVTLAAAGLDLIPRKIPAA